jgi:Tol biopolymer transport system component
MTMPDLREAFRNATDRVAPDPGALERQLTRQRRSAGRRKIGAFVAVAAVLAVMIGVILATAGARSDDREPAVTIPPGPGLFSLDVASGELSPFHDPGPLTREFELSPDGQHLLMSWRDVSDGTRRLWIASADGTDAAPLVTTDAAMGTWLPDSRRIAYIGLPTGGDTRQVIIYDTVTRRTEVITDEESDPIDPTATPDGNSIVFAVTTRLDAGRAEGAPEGDEPGAFVTDVPPTSWLKIVDIASGRTRTLVTSDDTHYWLPDVDPTGRIVWVSARHGYVDFDDMVEIRMTDQAGGVGDVIISGGGEVPWVEMPLWSPDGTLLAYFRESPDGIGEVWMFDPDSDEHDRVGPGWPQTWLDDDTLLVAI